MTTETDANLRDHIRVLKDRAEESPLDMAWEVYGLRAKLAAERERVEGWSESCERYIRNAHEWRDRAVRAEAALQSIVEDWEHCTAYGGLGNRGEAYYDTAREALQEPSDDDAK